MGVGLHTGVGVRIGVYVGGNKCEMGGGGATA